MTPFTLPKIIDPIKAALQLTPGTYTELVNDTWDGQDVDTDPTLKAADNAASLAAEMPDDLPGGSDVTGSLGSLGTTIPAQGASTLASDMAAAQAAQDAKYKAYVTAAGTVPFVGELPINPAGYSVLVAPPTQVSFDLGKVPIGVPITPYKFAFGNVTKTGDVDGVQDAVITGSQGFDGNIDQEERDSSNGAIHYDFYLTGTPNALGVATVQINYAQYPQLAYTILTVTMTVVAPS